MRIGCLQFAPKVGDVDNNLNLADDILSNADPEDLDLLILPELAFSGYNFKTLREIYPHLEPTGSGISSVWARTTALKYNCAVAVGYPESADVSHKWPTSPEYYNSLIMVNQDGDAWALYRKSHLYYTDESWALEGPDGFWKGYLPGVGKLAMGICMDINPYRFEAPWDEFEFATHALKHSANVVIVSMAWLTHENPREFTSHPKEPDMDTLTYWVKRMEPLIRCESEEEIIVIFANRSGVEGDVLYAGTSAVLGIKGGEVTVYGLLGRGENELLVVDTSQPGLAKLVYRPEAETDASVGDETQGQMGSDATPQGHQQGESDLSEQEHNPYPESEYLASERANDFSRRAGGHVFIPADIISAQTLDVVNCIDNESPISPRYFWTSSAGNTDGRSRIPSFSANNTYEQWHTLLSQHDNHPAQIGDDEESIITDIEPSSEFSTLVKGLSHFNTSTEAAMSRPFSTKSRNASRSHRDRSASRSTQISYTISNRNESYMHTPPVSEHVVPQSDIKDRSIISNKIKIGKRVDRLEARSPDLEKLDADLMVFEREGASRQKRDSLLCHVDNDDYIILQTARKDGISRHQKSLHSPTRSSRPSSRQTPRQPGSRKHNNSRSSVGRSGFSREPECDMGDDRMHQHSSAHQNYQKDQDEALSSFSKDVKRKTSHHNKPVDKRSALPSQRSHKLIAREASVNLESEDTVLLQKQTLPVPSKKGRREHRLDDVSTLISERLSDIPIIFSPDGLEQGSSLYASSSIANAETPQTGITIPDTGTGTFPLTPKAMKFERELEPQGNTALDHTMSALTISCEREAPDLSRGRPSSAVW